MCIAMFLVFLSPAQMYMLQQTKLLDKPSMITA